MPTREVLASFWRDWDRLTPQQQRAFREAVAQFIADPSGDDQSFHPRLRVKRVQGHPGVWEMTWAYDGRATFQYGDEVHRWSAAHHLAPRWHPCNLPPSVSRISRS